MSFLQSLMLKLLAANKEHLLAMGIKVLVDAYEDYKDDLAAKIIALIPETNRNKVHPEEMINFMNVLQECAAKIAIAAKPLFSE